MANADTENTSQTATQATGQQSGNEGNKAFKEMQEQLQAMNSKMEETLAAIAASNQRNTPKVQEVEENLYDPQVVLQRAERIFDTKYRTEKQKDMTIFNLAQDYPEIQTDPKIRQAVLDAQKTVPEHMRDTAEGYQLAVLQATSRAGLIPKSQRKTVDDDVSYDGTRRQAQAPKKRVKVSDAMIEVAQRMGRNTDDPEVMKRLEDAANRDTFTKYR